MFLPELSCNKEEIRKVRKLTELFNAKEIVMFDLTGYKPEEVKEVAFEVMKGKGNVCKVNHCRIEDYAGDDEAFKDHRFLRYELEVVSDKYAKRKVWKSVDLQDERRPTKTDGSLGKSRLEKLADTFFTLGLEFSNEVQLFECSQKFAEMVVVCSFNSFKPEDKEIQLHTITGLAEEGWEEAGAKDSSF